jgi:CHASE2 domain-containing sensor protein
MVATYALSRSGALHGLEHMILDAEMHIQAPPPSPVAIVMITDADYDAIFQGHSPLDPDRLHDIITDIAVSAPSVIGVDIDTSDPQFKTFKIEPEWRDVVRWERDVYVGSKEDDLEPLDILGGQDLSLNDKSGIPALLDDPEDRATRRYSHCIKTKGGLNQSFTSSIVAAYSSALPSNSTSESRIRCENSSAQPSNSKAGSRISCESSSESDPMLIGFTERTKNSRFHISASKVHQISGMPQENGQRNQIPELCHKIVLLGGSYRDYDRHFTPLGKLVGVEVLANAIETQASGNEVRAHEPWMLFMLDFVAASMLVLLFHLFPASVENYFAFALVLTVLIALFFSFVAFHSLSRFADFWPTLLAVLLFEFYVHVRERSVLRASTVVTQQGQPAGPDVRQERSDNSNAE